MFSTKFKPKNKKQTIRYKIMWYQILILRLFALVVVVVLHTFLLCGLRCFVLYFVETDLYDIPDVWKIVGVSDYFIFFAFVVVILCAVLTVWERLQIVRTKEWFLTARNRRIVEKYFFENGIKWICWWNQIQSYLIVLFCVCVPFEICFIYPHSHTWLWCVCFYLRNFKNVFEELRNNFCTQNWFRIQIYKRVLFKIKF